MSDELNKTGEGNKLSEGYRGNTGGHTAKSKSDPLRSLFWGLAFIVLGSLLLAHSQGWLAEDRWFPYFLIVLGAICLADVLIRYLHPTKPYFSFARLITGAILIFIGISFVIGFVQWLPVVLIIVGLAIVAGFNIRRNHSIYN